MPTPPPAELSDPPLQPRGSHQAPLSVIAELSGVGLDAVYARFRARDAPTAAAKVSRTAIYDVREALGHLGLPAARINDLLVDLQRRKAVRDAHRDGSASW